jgi:hypothetical protein
MSKRIWKFPAPIQDDFTIELPEKAEILCVQVQREQPQLWALCRPYAATETRRFCWFGTGHPVDDAKDLRYIGTVQFHDLALVFHLFEQPTS